MELANVSLQSEEIENNVPLMIPKRPRGFAAMSAEKRKEISSRGAKKLHELGLAHKFSFEEAVMAGRKGGLVKPTKHAEEIAG